MDAQRDMTVVDRDSLALARAIIPESPQFGGADARTVAHAEAIVRRMAPQALGAWRTLQRGLAEAARLWTGQPLHALRPDAARTLVETWSHHRVMGRILYPVAGFYKVVHFDRLDLRGSLRRRLEPLHDGPARWHQQVLRCDDEDTPEELECDVVVVGTGAGGAVVGRHLAEQGHAVVFVDEGPLRGRGEFPGNFLGSMQHLYRAVATVGSPPIFVTRGRLVGGSTAVNGGSTLLPPAWVTDRWCEELDSDEFSLDALSHYYNTVSTRLSVEPVPERIAGPIYRLLDRAARDLGWQLELMPRNAPGCEGKGFCDNGCRAGARQSTDRSYIPGALERGAMLASQLQVDRLVFDGSRISGVSGTAVDKDGKPVGRRVTVRSQIVVLAMGAIHTPSFMLGYRDRFGFSPQLGRGLTVHPSGATLARFDQPLFSEDFVPQSVLVKEFLKEGLLLSSAMPDRHMLPGMVPYVGSKLRELVEAGLFVGGAGFLASDQTRGRVRRSRSGKPLVTYQPSKADARLIHRGHYLVAKMLLAAGAREVYPCMARSPVIASRDDLERFEGRPPPLTDVFLAAFHPLGTCRMGRTPAQGVVDLDHQVFGAPGLFVVDGSAVPGPLGVNPQATIMAWATRAAERVAAHVT